MYSYWCWLEHTIRHYQLRSNGAHPMLARQPSTLALGDPMTLSCGIAVAFVEMWEPEI